MMGFVSGWKLATSLLTPAFRETIMTLIIMPTLKDSNVNSLSWDIKGVLNYLIRVIMNHLVIYFFTFQIAKTSPITMSDNDNDSLHDSASSRVSIATAAAKIGDVQRRVCTLCMSVNL